MKELSSLGLNSSTLHLLVSRSEGYTPPTHEADKPAHLQYEFEGIIMMAPLINNDIGTTKKFQPKILLTIDDDLAVSADLSPETKRVLEDLMNNSATDKSGKIVEVTETEKQPSDQSVIADQQADDDDNIFQTDEDIAKFQRTSEEFKHSKRRNSDDPFNDSETARHRTIEITLHADSEFFDLLTKELSSIDDLQARQKDQLTSQVNELGKDVLEVTKPSKSGSTSDLYAWRQVFSLYRDASIFFAMTERDHGARNAQQARERVQWFQSQLVQQNLVQDRASSGLSLDSQI